jgi:hypothetical protein
MGLPSEARVTAKTSTPLSGELLLPAESRKGNDAAKRRRLKFVRVPLDPVGDHSPRQLTPSVLSAFIGQTRWLVTYAYTLGIDSDAC